MEASRLTDQGLPSTFRSVIDWPDPESDVEDGIFAMSALIFVEPTKSERAL